MSTPNASRRYAVAYWTSRLNLAISRIGYFQDRYMILVNVGKGCETQREQREHLIDVEDWFKYQIEQSFDEIARVQENDGAILATIASKFPERIALHKYARIRSITRRAADRSRLLIFAQKHSANQRFAIEFAFSLYDALVQKAIDKDQAHYLLGGILSVAVPHLCVRGPKNWSLHPWCAKPDSTSAHDQYENHADRMIRLLHCCIMVGLHGELHLLLQHYFLDVQILSGAALQQVILPYLQRLLTMMIAYRIPLTTPSYQWQFQQAISLFIIRYVGIEPPEEPPRNFSRPPLGCASPSKPFGCPTCREMDSFLVHPLLQTIDISAGLVGPEHLAAQLRGRDYVEMTIVSRNPETLTSTVRITKKGPEPDPRHGQWYERGRHAHRLIQGICSDDVWRMLLGDRYDECMSLRAVRRPS